MTGIITLDIVIGLIFVYLIYSLLATIILEFIATNFNLRAKMLEKAIIRMLEENVDSPGQNQSLSKEFYNHPLIKFLGKNKRHPKPSYLKKTTFSKVVIDLLKGKELEAGNEVKTLIEESLKTGTPKWSNGATKIGDETLLFLKTIWTDAQGDVEKFRAMLENWFDETMERATGWYKKHTQAILFVIGLVLAIVFNVDTIKIADKLKKDPKLREQLVQQADAFTKAHPDLDVELKTQQEQIDKYLFPDINKSTLPADSLERMKEEKRRLDSACYANNQLLKQQRNTLFDQANNLIDEDINKMNGILGLSAAGYCSCGDWPCLLKMLVGWILTALAISLGAPFWFDLLNKLMKVRNSVASISTTATQNQDSTDVQSTNITRKG
ncbi:MAG: hypothetical protein M0P66_00095 [Salinivirgaceae bacterium]|nr:hypothetical protein [Salinivirgaceae bacterium]